MAGKENENRLFVGGLSRDVTERQLEDAFSRFGKIMDCQVMLERETGRPRGFGFLSFADRRGMETAIREMDGREFGERVISVNKAQSKLGGDDPDHGYSRGYSTGGRGSLGGDRGAGQDCFKCGSPGHWARDCPSALGGRASPPRSRYGGVGGRGDRYGGRGDRYGGGRDRFMDVRYDHRRYGDRDRYDGKEVKFGSRDHYANDRYPPIEDRFGGDRYGGPPPSDRYRLNGYGKDKGGYDRDGGGPRGNGDRYGPARSYRERPGPYDRPKTGGRPSSFERY